MLKNWQKISLVLSTLSVLVSSVPAQAEIRVLAPFDKGGYHYEALAMNSYCENFYHDGKVVGSRQVQGSAWHSPRSGKNIRCEYWGITTASRTGRKTETKLMEVTNFSYASMCKFQQGTSQFILSRDRQVLYCGRRI
jgi:hypothetical protein